MSEKIKIGVFGGGRGKSLVKSLLKHPHAEICAVCDKHLPTLQSVKEIAESNNSKVECYTNFEDFINHPGMDAVVLANYANEHATYGIKCLRAGKHVLSEVLPCETMSQAVELIEAVEETGLVYQYAENYCYMYSTFEMWKRYRTGELGEVMYGEGEYIHDCTSLWPSITYGERNHWRNRMHPHFYCTHSLGPLIYMTGMKPVKVVGFEGNSLDTLVELGYKAGFGIEMVTMENGAIFKSIHGGLKREPSSYNWQLYCQKGMMESGRLPENKKLNIYKEGEVHCKGEWEKYNPDSQIAADIRKLTANDTHSGSDFYSTHFFIEKILGNPDGDYGIDVYMAVDMGICGILAFRSALAGNISVDVPNLRIKSERDKYCNDHACCTPEVAGDQILPMSSKPEINDLYIPDRVYERVKNLWLQGKKG